MQRYDVFIASLALSLGEIDWDMDRVGRALIGIKGIPLLPEGLIKPRSEYQETARHAVHSVRVDAHVSSAQPRHILHVNCCYNWLVSW